VERLVDIIIVRSNSVTHESRLIRVIKSLSKRYRLRVLGWNREGIPEDVRKKIIKKTFRSDDNNNDNNDNTDTNNSPIFSMFKLRAPHGKPALICYLPLLFYFPLFWAWVFIGLIMHRPRVVHACDLDTVVPCYIYKKIFRKTMVFEIVDRYAMTQLYPLTPKKFRLLFLFLNWLEEGFSKRADLLMTLSENVLASFHAKPRNSVTILNCPEDYINNRTNGGGKKTNGSNGLRIMYGGQIMAGRGLEHIASAVMDIDNVIMCVYGKIVDKALLNSITTVQNVIYRGFLQQYDDYHNALLDADVIVAIYTEDTPSHPLTMHNKVLEAMMSGVPIITNFSSDFVNEIGFGIIVEYGNIEQIKSAIITLRDNPELRKRLGDNGRKAFVEKYNWGIMEQKLYEVYQELY
jgi:glycosyltransferase involved in cell wall biosynthesis